MNIEDWLYTPLGCSFVKERLMETRFYQLGFVRFISLIFTTLVIGGCGGETVPGSSCIDSACTEPPSSVCQGDTLVAYSMTGTCDQTGQYVYQQEVTNCIAQDAQCMDGACVNIDEDLCEGVGGFSTRCQLRWQQCVDLCRIRRVRWRCVSIRVNANRVW